VKHDIGRLVGYNREWKQKVNLGANSILYVNSADQVRIKYKADERWVEILS